jgi:hypothetical protein
MKTPTLLATALALALAVTGAGTASWAGEAGRTAPAGPAGASPGGRVARAIPVGVSRCCPHRLPGVGIVRTGGLAGTPPGPGEASALEPCDACADWEACARELEGAGASMQTMPLRNGIMHVFTADAPARVRVVQAALSRHYERMSALITAGESARLCSACRALRGAAVSGKLAREIIKIEGGCITLTTSPDPAVVARIHAEAGIPSPPRPKP